LSSRIGSRVSILNKIAAGSAAGSVTADSANFPREYTRRGSLDAEARTAKMIERLREYDTEVTECTPDHLTSAIAEQLAQSGRKSFVVPAGLAAEWLAPGFDWKVDGMQTGPALPTAEIENCEGVMTACFCAVADSGTIVLHHSAAEGRRVVSLLPDWHLCILRAGQIVETLPEYFDRCSQIPALATWISGPSATADIEMTRIKGVHGPRFLNVIVVRDDSGAAGNRDERLAM